VTPRCVVVVYKGFGGSYCNHLPEDHEFVIPYIQKYLYVSPIKLWYRKKIWVLESGP